MSANQLSFFNTTNLAGSELQEMRYKAVSQDVRVYTLMNMAGMAMSPDDVWRMYCQKYSNCPLTSIRRSMTNLTRRGYLSKTPSQKLGMYGKKVYKWKAIAGDSHDVNFKIKHINLWVDPE